MMNFGLRNYIYSLYYKLSNSNKKKPKFKCPICNYFGPFIDRIASTGLRKHAKCPRCASFERHRLQKLVLDKLSCEYGFSEKRILHLAPESFFSYFFKSVSGCYITADRFRSDVDIKLDLRQLPFSDRSFDIIHASHVLEHIKEDELCLAEIHRVLAKGGVAILPVPIVAEKTIEYPHPNPKESGHVRAPGLDYYDRYNKFFEKVNLFTSQDFSDTYQIYVYEDRSQWPNADLPWRKAISGEKHMDIVSVCFA